MLVFPYLYGPNCEIGDNTSVILPNPTDPENPERLPFTEIVYPIEEDIQLLYPYFCGANFFYGKNNRVCLKQIFYSDTVTTLKPLSLVTTINGIAINQKEYLTDLGFSDKCVITVLPSSFCSSAKKLKNVYLNKNIVTLNASAFSDCSNLDNFNWDFSDITKLTLGNYVFQGTKLNEKIVELLFNQEQKPKAIGFNIFRNCSNMKNVIVSYTGNGMFSDCKNLLSITFTGASFSESCCSGCISLKEINFNDQITSIPASAFKGCTSLEEISFDDNIVQIGGSAFADCSSLKKINWGNHSEITLSSSAFSGTGIKQIGERGPEKEYFSFPQNLTVNSGSSLFENTKSLKTADLTDYPFNFLPAAMFRNSSVEEVILNKNITELKIQAFQGCENLLSLDLSNITKFGSYALSGTGISEIDFKENWILDGSVFSKCQNLTKVDLSILSKLSSSLFSECNNLKEIVIGDKITTIPDSCFRGTRLKKIQIPKQITSISYNAFHRGDLEKEEDELETIYIDCKIYDENEELISSFFPTGAPIFNNRLNVRDVYLGQKRPSKEIGEAGTDSYGPVYINYIGRKSLAKWFSNIIFPWSQLNIHWLSTKYNFTTNSTFDGIISPKDLDKINIFVDGNKVITNEENVIYAFSENPGSEQIPWKAFHSDYPLISGTTISYPEELTEPVTIDLQFKKDFGADEGSKCTVIISNMNLTEPPEIILSYTISDENFTYPCSFKSNSILVPPGQVTVTYEIKCEGYETIIGEILVNNKDTVIPITLEPIIGG